MLRQELRAQRQWVAEGVHELRTPLATVRGVLETLRAREADLPREVRDGLVSVALRNVVRLGSRMEGLADLERLHDPRTWLRPMQVTLGGVVERVVIDCADLLGDHDVDVTLADGVVVTVDEVALEHALTSVLDAATRHSPPASAIRVHVTTSGRAASIDVDHDGPGSVLEDLPRVFEPLDDGEDDRDAVTILGLGIARRLAEVSGGSLHLHPRPDAGTTIRMTLPLSVPPRHETR